MSITVAVALPTTGGPTITFTGGTPVALSTPLAALEDSKATSTDGQALTKISPNDLQNVPAEINGMIELFQLMWGSQIGTNHRLDYWITLGLMLKMMQSLYGKGAPRQGVKL